MEAFPGESHEPVPFGDTQRGERRTIKDYTRKKHAFNEKLRIENYEFGINPDWMLS